MSQDDLLRRYAPRLAAELSRINTLTSELATKAEEFADEVHTFSSTNEAWEEADKDATDDGPHTGVMVALFPAPGEAAQLVLDEDGAEPVDELHVTLAFLGNVGAELQPEDQQNVLRAVSDWAKNQPPILAATNGIGMFDQDPPVTYANIDSPQLPQVHQTLREALQNAQLAPLQTHGFTPHMTLAYADHRQHNVPQIQMTFTYVVVAFAGQRTVIELLGNDSTPTAPHQPQLNTSPTTAAQNIGLSVGVGDIKAGQGDPSQTARSFTTEINGRQIFATAANVVKAGMREPTLDDIVNERLLTMRGRFVGADKPNRNGAFWSSADLEKAPATVLAGPLNWLHEGRHIIGSITGADFIPARAAENAGEGPAEAHIVATSSIWKWIWPDEAFVVNQASELGQLWYSMECISKEVACAGPNGCGNTTTYAAYMGGAGCDHIRTRASVRHFKDPVFLGGAVIVPPTRPGWAEADASVLHEAASFAEKAFEDAGRPDVSANDWEQLMAQLVRYATPE